MKVIPLEAALPLFTGKITVNPNDSSDWKFDSNHLMGTVFKVKEKVYMTAAHVVLDAMEKGEMVVAYLNENNQLKVARVLRCDIKDSHDIAFLEADVPRAAQFEWSFDDVPALSDVKAIGYPHALDIQNRAFTTRGQKGHIVSNCTYELPGRSRQNIYELSFPVFEGMSGAALLHTMNNTAKVVGVCLGNRTTEMKVFDSREIIEDKGKTEIIEKYYAYTLGIAIHSKSISTLTSKLYPGTFQEYVSENIMSSPIEVN